ncbi:MAG: VOC family protein [Actinomycetota bacterium]
MKLDGIHHVTCITGDAPANVRFYVGTLGLRLVKKSVNQDVPNVYHLFYADDEGGAGSDITFFEYPGIHKGTPGDGQIHLVTFRVGSDDSLDFWEQRLKSHGFDSVRDDGRLQFEDPDGLKLELTAVQTTDEPLRALHPEIPEEHALQGFDSVRAYTSDVARSKALFEDVLNFEPQRDNAWESRGESRGSFFTFDEAPGAAVEGAGSVHHVAWACAMDEHEAWHKIVSDAGTNVTPIIDRFYFRSIYFRIPAGVLFEIATKGPGFDSDEPLETLGHNLSLPPNYEHLRQQLEKELTPLPKTRAEDFVG